MKRNLLLLVSLFVGATAFAQWTRPTIQGAELQFSSEAEGDTVTYYLYNQEAGAFFTEGNDWGTRASYTTDFNGALQVMFFKYIGEEDTEWDGKTIVIKDLSRAKNNSWQVLFIDGEQAAYVDHGTQPNWWWEAETNKDAYRFFGAGINPTYNPTDYEGCYFGIDASASATVIYPCLDINFPNTDGPYYVDWKLIPTEGTDSATMAAFVEQNLCYNNALKLFNAFQKASESEYAAELQADIDAAKAVYDNPASTSEELAAAEQAMLLAINYASVKGASEDSPKDATGFIKNNDFSAGNIDGWTCTFKSGENAQNIGYQGASYTNGEITISGFIEAWTPSPKNPNYTFAALGDGKLSQLMPGLPAGKYKFTCDAIAVRQSDISVQVSGVELFALGGNLEAKQSIHTGNEKPEHFEVVFINPGGDVELGLRTNNADANWIAADNFTLTYYGEINEDPQKIFLDSYRAECEAKIEDPENAHAEYEVKKIYLAVLGEAQEAADNYDLESDQYADILARLQEAFPAFESSVNAYNTYIARIQEIQDDMASYEYDAEEAALLGDYIMDDNEIEPDEDMPNGSYWYIITHGTLDVEGIANETVWVNTLFQTVIANSLDEGDDCTRMLVNPNFADGGGKGWSKNINPTNFTWTGGLCPGFPVAESWHSTFDIYQDIIAPDGIYALSLNGFCRLDDGVDTEVPAEIYMNNGATKLMDIHEDLITEDQANDGFNCYLSTGTEGAWTTNPIFEGSTSTSPADNIDSNDGDGYYPNGMQGASVAFSADRYKATVYGIISGGNMRVGVRNTKSTHVWALWGNFKLTYMGKNAVALKTLLDEYLAQVDELLDNPFEAEVKAKLETADETAKEALAGGDPEEMYQALLGLVDIMTETKESIDDYKSFSSSIDDLTNAINDYADVAKTEVLENANTLLDKVLEAYDNGTANAQAIAEYKEQITEAVAKLKIPVVDPTDDDPADFTSWIVNPAFDDGTADGWTCISANRTNMGFQNNNTYTDEATLDKFVETWGNGFSLGDGFIRQTIKYLPEGTYKLAADAIAAHDVETTGMYLFAFEGDATDIDSLGMESFPNVAPLSTKANMPKHFELIFKKADENSDLTIGGLIKDTNSNWIALDNFALTYYGKNSALIPTSINAIDEVKPFVAEGIYNLAGQKLNALQKGINIVGGKKILVK